MICDTSTNDPQLNSEKTNDNYFLTYSFTSDEVCKLAKFLREKELELPEGLENFKLSLEKAIYNNLTLEEAKRFYS